MAESDLHLSEADQDRFPEVEWRSIRNFRNCLVHEYLELDPELIWFTVRHSLPPLKRAAETLLQEADAAAR
jgi:uncharacterized protein with HEPN domain